MPSTRFETSAGWINGRHAELAAALQRALIEGILIPEHDRDIRILEYPAGSFLPPPGRGPCYSIVEIAMFSGRSIAAKARFYAALQRELGPFGINEGDLKVTTLKQKWHDFKGDWKLTDESRIDGEIGLLGEPPPPAADQAPKRTQFPTIRLGGAAAPPSGDPPRLDD